jgi:hypothetical protein
VRTALVALFLLLVARPAFADGRVRLPDKLVIASREFGIYVARGKVSALLPTLTDQAVIDLDDAKLADGQVTIHVEGNCGGDRHAFTFS